MTLLIEGLSADDPLRAVIADKLEAAMRRGRRQPTSARVGFADQNGPKGGIDIRCAVTLELPRRPSLHADAFGANHRVAFDTALEAIGRELQRERSKSRTRNRRPKKYFVARQGLQPDGEAALPPARRRRRSA
jgi:ribosome-associated translation inhibitor RaiA